MEKSVLLYNSHGNKKKIGSVIIFFPEKLGMESPLKSFRRVGISVWTLSGLRDGNPIYTSLRKKV